MKQYQVFISYSSRNQEIASDICQRLEDVGIKCWIDYRDESAGSHFGGEIVKAIEKCQLVVLVFSEYANVSNHIESEIALAFESKKTIIPFLIDNTEINHKLKYALAATHRLKAYPDYTKKIKALVTAVGKQLGFEDINQNKEQKIDSFIDKTEIVMSEQADDELKDMEKALAEVNRRINKKIDSLYDDLDFIFEKIIRCGSQQLEDAVDRSCHKMTILVDNWKRTESVEKLKVKLDCEVNILVTKTLKRTYDEIERDARLHIKNTLNDFFIDAEDYLLKLPPELDLDHRSFINDISQRIDLGINSKSLFQMDQNDEEESSWGDALLQSISGFFDGFFFGLPGLAGRVFMHENIAYDAKKTIYDMQRNFDSHLYLDQIISNKDRIIDEIKVHFNDGLIVPIQKKLDKIKQQYINKQKQQEAVEQRVIELNIEKEEI